MTYLDPSIIDQVSDELLRSLPTPTLDESPFPVLDKRGCVVCSSKPACPACDSGESCSFTLQSCSECPSAICVSLTSSSSSSSSPSSTSTSSGGGSHTNAGAIAGGVVGGLLAFFAIIGFLIWKYVYSSEARQKRLDRQLAYEEDLVKSAGEMSPDEKGPGGPLGGGPGGIPPRSPRYSKYNRASRMSSTTVSSISGGNVIPIAYIPGVFSRTADTSSSEGAISEQYFSASDILRNSQYSNDGAGIRSSIATTDYRGSVAYASNPVIVTRASPNLVNLTGGGVIKDTNDPEPRTLTVDVSRAESTYSQGSLSSPAESTFIGAIQQVDTTSQRMNARSIRIGKTGVGLQSQLIAEESDEEEERPPMPSLSAEGNEPKSKGSAANKATSTIARVFSLGGNKLAKSAKTRQKPESIPPLNIVRAGSRTGRFNSNQNQNQNQIQHQNQNQVENNNQNQNQNQNQNTNRNFRPGTGVLNRVSSQSSSRHSLASNASRPNSVHTVASPTSVSVTSPTGSATSSQLLDLRASTFSGFDVQFDVDDNGAPGQAPAVPPKPPSRNASVASRKSRNSRTGPTRAASTRTNGTSRDSLDYSSHLPMEALLYARSEESLGIDDLNRPIGLGSSSPFGDENSV